MTTESEPELTDTQKAYNVAQYEIFQLAAYGHCTYTPRAELLTAEGKAEQADYNGRIRKAREELEAAVLRLVAEHAETFRGDWGVPAAWLRSLADDPAELSLLAVRPDERETDAPAAPVAAPPTGQAGLRDLIAEALSEARRPGLGGMTEADAVAYMADAVLSVLPAPVDRAAALAEAERAMLTYALDQAQERIWSEDGFTDEDQAAVTSLRRLAAETPGPETQGAPPRSKAARLLDAVTHSGPGYDLNPTAPAVVAEPGKEQEAATVVRCSLAILGRPHAPHSWEPQPGMDSAHCPGHTFTEQEA